MSLRTAHVCFSNRPVWVKRLQTSHHSGVDVTHGLVLLFGIGATALPAWGSRTRRNNLSVGLAAISGRSKQTYDLASFIVPRGTSCHRVVELVFLLVVGFDLSCHAAATSCRVQRNSVPSLQMRCMITAKRRASATIAFFMPRRLAICIAQALSQDHCVERISRIWAAS